MNVWEILGIEPTDDKRAVRRAYAEKSKLYHPETHPEEFQKLHNAYKAISAGLKTSVEVSEPENRQVLKEVSEPEKRQVPKDRPLPEERTVEIPVKKWMEENALHTEQKAASKTAQSKEAKEQYAALVAGIEQEAKTKKLQKLDYEELKQFEDMLDNQYYPEEWRKFFLRPAFLKRQYDVDYINALAKRIDEKLQQTVRREGGRIPQYALIYLIIAYGCMFDKVGNLVVDEEVYKKELLSEMIAAFRLYDAMFFSYVLTENKEELLSERLAFYVYRNLLALLDREKPDRTWLRFWLIDGLVSESNTHLLALCHYEPYGGVAITPTIRRSLGTIKRSPIIFELLAFLLTGKRQNQEVFEDVLEQVCLSDVGADAGEEKQLLLLMIEENRKKRREEKK